MHFARFALSLNLRSKVLSFGNSQINLEFHSLIRTFAGGCPAKTDIEDEKGEEQRTAALLYQGRAHDDLSREVGTHHTVEYTQHSGADLCYRDVFHRRLDGGTSGGKGFCGHRTGGDHWVADGRFGFCCEHGILRAGGPLYRSQRLRGCPQSVAPVDRLLSHLESDHLGDSSRHRAIPAVLAGWIC